jgi:hypothetical protein
MRIAASLAIACVLLHAAPAAATEGMLLAGLGKPTNDQTDNFDWGPSFAGSIGGRVSNRLSLHAQLQLSILDPEINNTSGQHFGVSFVPLIHVLDTRDNADIVVGPTVGVYRTSGQFEVLGIRADAWEWGLQAGVIFGAFFTVTRTVGLGFYLQYAWLFPERECVERPTTQLCNDQPEDEKSFFSLGFGLSF